MLRLGISFKTQALYVTVFLTRYLDLFYDYVSLYNTVMKIFFIGSSCYILYLMKVKFRCVTLVIRVLGLLLTMVCAFHVSSLVGHPFAPSQ